MEIHYCHHYGRMSDCDLAFCLVSATDVSAEEEGYALEHGWTRDEEESRGNLWWQTRSTRLKASKFKFNRKSRRMLKPAKGIEAKFRPAKECNVQELNEVYIRYCNYKNFTIEDNYVESCLKDIDEKYVGEYRQNGILIGYVVCRIHSAASKAMTSIQFCWDYKNPRLYLGKYSLIKEIEFAYNICKFVKSNAIVIVKDYATLGIGAGQQNRLDSCRIAVQKAKKFQPKKLHNSIAASDAFFPFADGIKTLIKSGVKLIIQPGGSIRDKEVIEAANKAKIKMVFTGTRHFNH